MARWPRDLRADTVIHLLYRPGQFVLRGEPLACIWPPHRLADLDALIERYVRIGRHRLLKQDCEFGIAQIVEIAIRALSPAVNDTFTGVGCVDWMADALLIIADVSLERRMLVRSRRQDTKRACSLRLERLVKTAFDQIRQAAADNPAVLIRILDTIRRIASADADGGVAASLDGSGKTRFGGLPDDGRGQAG